jgi:RNA polymerase sigma factor (TIGR02999 family)
MATGLPALDPETYAHQRALAGRIHSGRGRAATLQPTALLHEAWMKVASSKSRFENREHFLAVAAKAMRQLLVDRVRARVAQKRGGGWEQVTLSGVGDDPGQFLDVLDLDAALTKLEAVDPVAAKVALMRTFGGMTAPEAAEALGTSVRTLQRSWRFARVFLARELAQPEHLPG